MKWAVIIFFLGVSLKVMGQEGSDSTDTGTFLSEWRTSLYDQAEKIFNGLYLTPIENPALAGLDRQLVATYGGGVKNTRVGGHGWEESPTPAFWSQRAMVDFAFAGKRRNVGVALMYEGGREYKVHFHKIGLAHSYRFHLRKHRLTFGLGWHFTNQLSKDMGPFGDSIDPRYGYIYASGEMIYAQVDPLWSAGLSTGLFYDWKRLFISYSFRFGAEMPAYRYTGVIPIANRHTLSAGYHFRLPADLTLSPMLTSEHVHHRWSWNPALVFTYKDMFTLGVSVPHLSHVRIDAGVQLWDKFRIAAGVGFYHQDFMQELNGMAFAGGSLRYMLPIWKR